MSLAAHSLPTAEIAPAQVVLLGTGGVGRAVLARLDALHRQGIARGVDLVGVGNSRRGVVGPALLPTSAADLLDDVGGPGGAGLVDAAWTLANGDGARVVIDATASDAVAARHATWLSQGVHVVTANKLGQGGSLLRWQSIRSAQSATRTHYGDSATVGAGLPLLRSIRSLVAGGDAITGVAGVLSGSLAWLFGRYDGSQPFSELVREARERGYTEPDPRDDLSGADVRRKLLILARAAGVALDEHDVAVQPVLDDVLANAARADVDAALSRLDAPMRLRLDAARSRDARLRVVARWHDGAASVGLEALAAHDELAAGAGTDNRVVIHSSRYRERPLVIQGPGAGADVTAAALIDDLLAIVAR